jgi:pSer/pThr/pTyr-binding forkhead associated (FHA) protein
MQNQICPQCGHPNPTTALQCEKCHADLEATLKDHVESKPITKPIDDLDFQSSETRHIDDLLNADEELNTGRALMQGDLVLTVQQTGKQFRIENSQLQEVLLGRRNRDTGFMPTVDLTDVEGQKHGVSRRHATLSRRDNHLVLIDHSSSNGTYLNGKRLMPEQPRVVRDADMIKLGQLEILVSFQKK